MVREFDRVMEFFSLSPKEKEARIQEVFEDSVEYFEYFKHILMTGTPEEKKQAAERVVIIQKKIKEEVQRICEKTGMTEEQLTEIADDSKNFSPEQWEAIEKSKKKLEKGIAEIQKVTGEQDKRVVGEKKAPRKGVKSRKKRKKQKKWIAS